jgi:hypothetical protein
MKIRIFELKKLVSDVLNEQFESFSDDKNGKDQLEDEGFESFSKESDNTNEQEELTSGLGWQRDEAEDDEDEGKAKDEGAGGIRGASDKTDTPIDEKILGSKSKKTATKWLKSVGGKKFSTKAKKLQGKVDDPEAVVASYIKKSTGKWPSQGK